MFEPTKEQIELLAQLNATYRFVAAAPTFIEDERTGRIVQDKSNAGGTYCEILDLTVGGVPYVKEQGDTEPAAFAKALEKAKTAPKPLTPAQRFASENDAEKKRLQAELDEARAKLAAIEQGNRARPQNRTQPVANAT